MSETTSPATAENPPATDGAPPQTTGETQTTTSTPAAAPTVDEVLKGDNLDEIRALLRASDDVLVGSKRDQWSEGLGDDDPPAEETIDPPAVASPGAQEKSPDAEPAKPTPAEAEQRTAAETDRTKKDKRVRYNRFPESDQPVIERMARKEGLSFDQARAELIAEGVLPKPEAHASPASAAADAPDPLAAQQQIIAELKAKRDEAKTAFDLDQAFAFQDQLDEAKEKLRDLKQESSARASSQQSEAQTRLQSAVAEAEADAIALFPAAAEEGSELHQEISDLITHSPSSAFQDPDWPITFAARAARNIGYQPPAPAAGAKPVVVPKKPVREMPPGPASGSSAGATETRGPTLEQRISEAEAKGDVETLRQLLRENGTRTLD